MKKSLILFLTLFFLSFPLFSVAQTYTCSFDMGSSGTGTGIVTDTNCNQAQYYPVIGPLCKDSNTNLIYTGTGSGVALVGGGTGGSNADFNNLTVGGVANVTGVFNAKGGAVVTGNIGTNTITTSWAKDSSYQSHSIVSVIQEIVNLGTIVTDIVLWTDDHDGRSSSSNHRGWYSYAENSSKKTVLHIEYTTP